jgi:sugar phosphate isomerase/epimerase
MAEGTALLGLSSYAFRWAFGFGEFRPARPMTAQDLIEVAASAGLGAVQLCDNVPLLSFSRSELEAVRAHAERRGIVLETGIRGTRPDQLEKALDVTALLGASLLRVVVELDRAGERGIGPQLDQAAAELRGVMARARELSICLAVENHASVKAAEMVRLLEAVGDEACGACVDTMNSVLLLERPEETVTLLAPYALSVHLKDFRLAKDADGYRVIGTALGGGILDLETLVPLLRSRGRVRSWHLELYGPRSGSAEETLAHERQMVVRSTACLKGLKRHLRA